MFKKPAEEGRSLLPALSLSVRVLSIDRIFLKAVGLESLLLSQLLISSPQQLHGPSSPTLALCSSGQQP